MTLSEERFQQLHELFTKPYNDAYHYKVAEVSQVDKLKYLLRIHAVAGFDITGNPYNRDALKQTFKTHPIGTTCDYKKYFYTFYGSHRQLCVDLQYKREEARLRGVIDAFFGTVHGWYVETFQHKALGSEKVTETYGVPACSINVINLFNELGVTICGGTILSLFTASKVNDIDLYVKDPENIVLLTHFFELMFANKPNFNSINAVTYRRRAGQRVYTVQLITKFHGEPQEIFDYFDFTITNACYDFQKYKFVFGDRFFPDLSKRVLVYSGKSLYPICALHRINKYTERGFRAPGSTLMHIALAIVQLDITTYAQLKEQLMGIDTSYLSGLLDAKDPSVPVDYGEFIQESLAAIDLIANSIDSVNGQFEYNGDDNE